MHLRLKATVRNERASDADLCFCAQAFLRVWSTEAVMDATQPIRLHPSGSFRSHVNSVSNKAVPQEASEDTMLLNQFPNQKWAQLGAA